MLEQFQSPCAFEFLNPLPPYERRVCAVSAPEEAIQNAQADEWLPHCTGGTDVEQFHRRVFAGIAAHESAFQFRVDAPILRHSFMRTSFDGPRNTMLGRLRGMNLTHMRRSDGNFLDIELLLPV